MVQDLKGEGIAVIWSTAYLDEAERCDRVLLLNEGKLLFQGAPSELTGRVAGRVFLVTGVEGERRAALSAALDSPAIIDGVIQGDALAACHARGLQAARAEELRTALGDNFGSVGDRAHPAALRRRLHRCAGRRTWRTFRIGGRRCAQDE